MHVIQRISLTLSILQTLFLVSLVYLGRDLEGWLNTKIDTDSAKDIFKGVLITIALALFSAYYWFLTKLKGPLVSFLHIVLVFLILLVTVLQVVDLIECVHLFLYAGLTITLVCYFSNHSLTWALIYSLLLANGVSLFDEALQYFHPRRVFDLRDLALNFTGCIFGILLYLPYNAILRNTIKACDISKLPD